jgi:lysophospholipase L1-like esterase
MRPRLVLFGDSITEQSFATGGWGAALADHFARQALSVCAAANCCV